MHLAEGTWTPDAYADALRRAWARSYAFEAFEADPVHSEPEGFEREGSLGSVQFIGTSYAEPVKPDESGAPSGLHSKAEPLTLPPRRVSRRRRTPRPNACRNE